MCLRSSNYLHIKLVFAVANSLCIIFSEYTYVYLPVTLLCFLFICLLHGWIMCPCYHEPQGKFVLLQRFFADKVSWYLQHTFVPVYKHFQTKLYNESEKPRNEWAHLSGDDDTSGDVCRARPMALFVYGTLVDRVYAENIAQTTNLKVRACHRVAGLKQKYWISIFSQFCMILCPSLLNVAPVFCADVASPGLTFVVGDIIQECCMSYHIFIWVCRRM